MRLSARRTQPSLTIVPRPSRRGAMSSPLQAAKWAQRRRPVKIPGNEGLGPPRGEWARGALLTKRRVGDQAVEGPGRGQIQRVKHQCAQRTDRQIGRELRLKALPVYPPSTARRHRSAWAGFRLNHAPPVSFGRRGELLHHSTKQPPVGLLIHAGYRL